VQHRRSLISPCYQWHGKKLVRDVRVELTSQVWKTHILTDIRIPRNWRPVNYIRIWNPPAPSIISRRAKRESHLDKEIGYNRCRQLLRYPLLHMAQRKCFHCRPFSCTFLFNRGSYYLDEVKIGSTRRTRTFIILSDIRRINSAVPCH